MNSLTRPVGSDRQKSHSESGQRIFSHGARSAEFSPTRAPSEPSGPARASRVAADKHSNCHLRQTLSSFDTAKWQKLMQKIHTLTHN
jgi:hypothetical protein